jgi:hypothetical protein
VKRRCLAQAGEVKEGFLGEEGGSQLDLEDERG